MKTKQLLLSLLAMLASITAKAYDFELNGVYYNITDAINRTIEVTGNPSYDVSNVNTCYEGNVGISSTIDYNGVTYTVTGIGKGAFYECRRLNNVILPNSVSSIGDYAFYNCVYLSITIPSSVTSIGKSAFYGCCLGNVTIPNSMTTIGERAFYGSRNIGKVTISNSATSIEKEAFCGCEMQAISIPRSVINIGSDAFSACWQLIDVIVDIATPISITENTFSNRANATLYVPVGSKTLYEGADYWKEFANIEELEDYIVFADADVWYTCVTSWDTNGDRMLSMTEAAEVTDLRGFSGNIVSFNELQYFTGLTSISNNAFNGCVRLTSISIPNGVTSIGNGVFYNCSGLSSISIPNGVTSIGDEVFYNCSGLTSITLPEGVTSIGYRAFAYCDGLTSITLPEGITSIGDRAFYDCDGLTSITIPERVTTIGNSVFQDCDRLASAIISEGVTSIGSNTFLNCYNLTSVVISGSVTIIPRGMFYGCKRLTSIIIPSSVTIIGGNAFQNCSSLTSITIPSSVTSIYTDAFNGCNDLTSVVSEIQEPFAYGSGAFRDISSTCTLTIPYGTRDAYIAAGWTEDVFKGGIVEEAAPSPAITFADANVKALCVANWDTSGDGELSEEEAAAVTDLGEVFRGNTDITSFNELQYFTGLTTIGNNAFDGCTGLTSIAIPASLKKVKTEAFKNCTSLSKVIVTDIAAWCGIIYDIKDPWEPLGDFPLGHALHLYSDENTEITEVVIPDGVTRIEPLAFRDAKYVTSVTIPNSVIYIGTQAFCGMHRLTSITIPQNVTTIEGYTFNDCQALSSVSIPEGVVNIWDNAFNNCISLTSISLPESLKVLGGHAFLGCSNLTSITIPDGITHLSRYAFADCPNLTTLIYNKAENALTKVNGVYQIGTAEDLCNFAILSTAASTDICAKLTADIDYTGYTFPGYNVGEHFQHIGLNGYCGTFDGNGHTITVDINNPDSWAVAALFRVLGKGGVIKNLRVAGRVESTSKYSAGIVSDLKSGKVSHCVSDVDIVSNIAGDCTDGGIAAIATYDGEESIVEYCVVAGSFQGSNAHHRGGIIGIGRNGISDNITIDNCLFLASVDELDVTESGTIIRNPTDKTTINNCYYLNVLGTVTSGTQTTTAQLTSGELCYLLNGDQSNIIWTQNLTGLDTDSYPLPFSTHAQVYANGNTYSNERPNIVIGDTFIAAVPCGEGTADLTFKVTSLSPLEVEVSASPENIAGALTIPATVQDGYGTELAVTGVGCEAFIGRQNLTAVTLSQGIIVIKDRAFDGCESLESVMLPSTLRNIYSGAFWNCVALSNINLPAGMNKISLHTFRNTPALKSIELPEGLTTIEYEAFRESGLESITFPSTLTAVDYGAFMDCKSLASIDFNGCSAYFAYESFCGCTSLEELNIPNTVMFRNSDGTWSWSNFGFCSSLRTVVFEAFEEGQDRWSTTSVFTDCTALETVILPSTSVMQNSFFWNCTNLQSVTYLEVADDFDPRQHNFNKMYEGLDPSRIQFTVPAGTAETLLKAGYMHISDKSGLPLVRSEFEAEATRITAMADALTDGDKTTLATAISEARTIANAAEDYAPVYAQIAAIKNAAKTYLSTATLSAGFDVTAAFVTNPNFDNLQFGWSGQIGWASWPPYKFQRGWNEAEYENDDVVINKFVDVVEIDRDRTILDGTILQTITNLPAGTYRLECDAIATWQNDASVEVTGVNLFAGTATTAIATENEKPQHFSVEFTQAEAGDCTIGIDINSTNANWIAMDNVRLYNLDARQKNYLSMADTEGITGGKATIKVDMTNEDEMAGVQFKVKLPTGMSINTNNNNELKVFGTSRTSGLTVSASYNEPGDYYQVLIYGVGTRITGNSGTLVTLEVSIPGALALGNYEVDVYDIALTDVQEKLTYPSDFKGTLQLVNAKLGDANRDGIINVADIICIANYILGSTPSSFDANAANVNGDAVINVADIIRLANIILNGNNTSVKEFIFESNLDPQ